MKFYKRKTDVEGTTTGDFDSFSASQLLDELVAVLGEMGTPQRWYLNTNEVEIDVVILDDTLDTSGVVEVIANHVPSTDVLPSPQDIIDSIVEWIAGQPSAPQMLMDRKNLIAKRKV